VTATGLIMSQVLPPPSRGHLKLISDYRQHLLEFDAAAKPGYTSLEGYVSARVLVEGLRRAGNTLTAARLTTALEGIKRYDLGGYEITFSPKSHDGSRYVDTGAVSSDGVLRF
jgi:branched-chain amino acid transport system substrate-binding protein